MSPAVVEDLKRILILPHGKTIKHYKAELEEKLKINDSLVAKDYTPNTEMNKRIAATIRKKDQTWIKCGLAMDHNGRMGETLVTKWGCNRHPTRTQERCRRREIWELK